MYSISNDDFTMVVRLLRSFSQTKGTTLREVNERRMAHLLLKKLKKKGEKGRSSPVSNISPRENTIMAQS